MEKIYIFGHKNPDTDSVTSAISLSYLKNQIGFNTAPRVLGDISTETRFVLEKFEHPKPKYLDNVFLQMQDISFKRDFYVNQNTSLFRTYEFLEENGSSGVAVVDDNKKFTGIVTLKNLIKNVIKNDIDTINTSYQNITEALSGKEILKFDEEISGKLIVASYRSTTFLDYVDLTSEHILIVGNRHSIIEYGIRSKVKLIIIIGDYYIKEEHINLAKENKVNIINSRLDSLNTIKIIGLSNYLHEIIEAKKDTIYFYETDYYKDFLTLSKRYKHNNYPILNKNGECLGLVRVVDIINKNKKKVILVDHNDKEQSVEGLEEAEIVEIVDHHNIGALSTNNPINIRSMTVGSTNTIIYQMFMDYQVSIPQDIAGLMLSGILSDTLILTSPTTTEFDRLVANELAEIAKVDLEKYGMEMLKAGTKLTNKTPAEVIMGDFKTYTVNNQKIGVSQVITFDEKQVLNNLESYQTEIDNIIKEKDLDSLLLAVTDVLTEGSYFIYSSNLEEVLKVAYRLDDIKQGTFVESIISRKKQIVPPLLENL